MLSAKVGPSDKLKIHGLLIGVEVEDGVDIEKVMKAVGDTLYMFLGVGEIDIDHLGEIETIDDVGVMVNDVPLELMQPAKES
jgi:hypothetical protein